MPHFSYQAINQEGKTISDSIAGINLKAVADNLKAQQLQIISLKPIAAKTTQITKLSYKLSVVDKANLCRYLGTMIKAGLPLLDAVSTIRADTTNKTLKSILSDIQVSLQQGNNLSSAFSKYPKVFDPVFVTIIRAGEQSGNLAKSFQYLEEQLTATHALSQKVKGALMYPAVIISTMLAVGLILIVFVVPQIAQVFLKGTFDVPKFTTVILQTGLALKENLTLLILIMALIIISIVIALRTNKGKQFIVNLIKRTPGVTGLFEKLDMARFSRTLATLLTSGVPITDALSVSTVALTQKKYASLVVALKADVKKGLSIASIMRRHNKSIPQMLISMVSTGEKTGTLGKILLNVGQFYEGELESSVKNFTALLEPIIMLIIGVGVGAMVLAVIAPIYSLVSNLQGIQ